MKPVEVSLPFAGRWMARNSPARRVPSHGSELFGERFAIDFIGVDERGRSARVNDWRTLFATEPPQRFVGFTRPILAPVGGTVVVAHDGEPDHEARRSQFALLGYAAGQASRLRQGIPAIAGNHVLIEVPLSGIVLALVHLKRGSLRVSAGQRVSVGEQIAECGNSGNSTQPHVHMQAMDSADLLRARGVPMVFRHFRESSRRAGKAELRDRWMPAESSIVEALPLPV